MNSLRSAVGRARVRLESFQLFLAARPDGLPRLSVLLIPLAFIVVVVGVTAAFGITGSSSGILWPAFMSGVDPHAIVGTPQSIRSDEWYVQTVWTVSQVQQGLPTVNDVFPGGMNSTIQHDLPSWDWSVLFRPELLGFWFLPLDTAMSLKWWLPVATLIGSAYTFFLTLMRTRPVVAAVLAVVFYLSPFLQWWHISPTSFTTAWAFLLMAAVIWVLRSNSRSAAVVFAVLVAYLTVCTGMLIYVPFIVPCALVALGFGIGYLLDYRERTLRSRIVRILPLVAAGAAALGVLAIWLMTRSAAVERFLSTKYPGERLQSVGAGTTKDLASILGGPFSSSITGPAVSPIGVNGSEASSFLLVGLFLAPALIYFWARSARRNGFKGSDWLSGSLIVLLLVVVVYYTLPGWDWVAHLTGLDRSTTARFRIGLGVLSFAMVAVFLYRRLERPIPDRLPFWVKLVCVGGAGASYVWLTRKIWLSAPQFLSDNRVWMIAILFLALSLIAILWDRFRWGVLALLVAAAAVDPIVNPLRFGIFDLRETPVAQSMLKVQEEDPGRWIAIGDASIATLTETALPALSGYQASPSPEMWDSIDPQKRFEEQWNRLGLVAWQPQSGPLTMTNPGVDVVLITFDSCGPVAQAEIAHVLAHDPIDQPCLALNRVVTSGSNHYRIYDVVAPPAK